MFDAGYLAAHAWLARHRVAVLLLYALILGACSAGLMRLTVDLSFRPLFATDAEANRRTAEFESVFGQASGSELFVILVNDGLDADGFFAVLESLSSRIAGVEGIAHVASAATMRVPEWQGTRLSARPALAAAAPEVAARFVADDGERLLIAATFADPLAALARRAATLAQVREAVREVTPEKVGVLMTGVTVVELAYESRVLRGQLLATALTTVGLVLLLAVGFGTFRAVLLCLLPASLALSATFGLMGWIGDPVTIINTALPALILVIGVADAVHMLSARTGASGSRRSANRFMLTVTGRACLFTTVTTAAGFLSLLAADLAAVAAFGRAAAIGIAIAWTANQLLLPALAGGLPSRARPPAWVDATFARMTACAAAAPRRVVAAALAIAAVFAAAVPALAVNQHFNEELPPGDPVRVAQALAESTFGGFLGPEIDLRSRDGRSLLEPGRSAQLRAFVRSLSTLPGVRDVHSVFDYLPPARAEPAPRDAVAALLDSPFAAVLSGMVSADQSRMVVSMRVDDIGTRRAIALRESIVAQAEELSQSGISVEVVGQWWLAQRGMAQLLDDMLTSLAVAGVVILPMLWLILRSLRLFVAALFANLLPLILPLGFMSMAGISLRIGTTVVLAIALGIAVDNTLHVLDRIVRSGRRGLQSSTGRAVLITTIALIGAFLSMLVNDLRVIREMGLVAAVTFAGAMLSDLLFLPALVAVLGYRNRRAAPKPATGNAIG